MFGLLSLEQFDNIFFEFLKYKKVIL